MSIDEGFIAALLVWCDSVILLQLSEPVECYANSYAARRNSD